MTQSAIYMVDVDGGLRRMTPSAPESEDRMQTLVARHPELITDGDGDLLLIRREQAIADGEDGAGRWSLDHLFVTRDVVWHLNVRMRPFLSCLAFNLRFYGQRISNQVQLRRRP